MMAAESSSGRKSLLRQILPGIAAAALYGTCSLSMTFANKALFSTYRFSYQTTLMALQMAFTLLALEILRAAKFIDIPRYTLAQGRMFAMPSFCYAINSVLGLRALTGLNIPMYSMIKRCTSVACLLIRPLVMPTSNPPSLTVIISVMFLTTGCVIAAYGDLAFDLAAYTYGSLSVIIQAVYLTLVQRNTQISALTTTQSLYLNSYNTLPFLTLYALFSGEILQVASYDLSSALLQEDRWRFWLLLLLVIGMGCMLNYSLFLCTSVNSALTTTVVGTMKGVLQTVIGMFTFGGIAINIFTVVGISFNMFGGLLYTRGKCRKR